MPKRLGDLGPLALRLMLAVGFLYHGVPKISSMAGHASFAVMLHGLGFPAPGPLAWLVGIAEVGGGLALLAGTLTVVVSAILIVEMLVALWKVHGPNGFSFVHVTGMNGDAPVFGMPGYEVNLVYIAMLLALALGGAGRWSVDAMRAAKRSA